MWYAFFWLLKTLRDFSIFQFVTCNFNGNCFGSILAFLSAGVLRLFSQFKWIISTYSKFPFNLICGRVFSQSEAWLLPAQKWTRPAFCTVREGRSMLAQSWNKHTLPKSPVANRRVACERMPGPGWLWPSVCTTCTFYLARQLDNQEAGFSSRTTSMFPACFQAS